MKKYLNSYSYFVFLFLIYFHKIFVACNICNHTSSIILIFYIPYENSLLQHIDTQKKKEFLHEYNFRTSFNSIYIYIEFFLYIYIYKTMNHYCYVKLNEIDSPLY